MSHRRPAARRPARPATPRQHSAPVIRLVVGPRLGDAARGFADPRERDVDCRGVLQQLFFDGVAVEPGDGAQPSRRGGPGLPRGLEVPTEALDVGPAGGEQGQAVAVAPGGELAQVQGRPAGSGRCTRARNPANASRSCSENTGPAGTRAAEVVVVATGTSMSGRDQVRSPAANDHLKLRTPAVITPGDGRRARDQALDAPDRRLGAPCRFGLPVDG
jgi:hypothetical protein